MPQKQAVFTKHALIRVGERVALTPDKILELLNTERAILLHLCSDGVLKWLFYSIPDQAAFIANLDEDGNIITIIPAKKKRASEITVSRFLIEKARLLAIGKPTQESVSGTSLGGSKKNRRYSIYWRCKFCLPDRPANGVELGLYMIRLEKKPDYMTSLDGIIRQDPELGAWLNCRVLQCIPENSTSKTIEGRFEGFPVWQTVRTF